MLLHLTGVHKTYATADGPLAVLNGVDLALGAGASLALTGESGSGKSTLLHLRQGWIWPMPGWCGWRGSTLRRPVTGRAQRCGAPRWGWCSSSST